VFASMEMFGPTCTVEQSRAWLPAPRTPPFGPDGIDPETEPPPVPPGPRLRPRATIVRRILLRGRLRRSPRRGSNRVRRRAQAPARPSDDPSLAARPQRALLRAWRGR
jgi:hypothetical protein